MVATLDQAQRTAIATKLADMKILQNLMISNEQKLLAACRSDEEIRDRLEDMLEDDQENLRTIDQAIAKFGTSSDAQEQTKRLVETIEGIMAGNELDLYEKAMQHEGLKHQLVMSGLLVHKAAQVAGDDLEKTIDPINKVNFKNRAHQEQLKGIIYKLGTRELVGKEPDQSIWASAEDAIAALKGIFGGLTD
ncbi:MAG: hypothetical protein KME06_03840 [Kastovskya adunca ATA6-11-RM4]|jgi:hypothetical protein|nr:hypothetical protein [Kastovskya adunca ATA6-11-RM4]